jgi:hypothetical protein
VQGDPFASPAIFPFFFIALWLAVGAILSILSRWTELAGRFPAAAQPSGTTLGGQVVSVGVVGENNVTYLTVSPEGLYLRSHFLFRFMRRPVLVPWTEVRYVSERKTLWWRSYMFDLGGITTIRVKKRAFSTMDAFLVGPSSAEARQLAARA